MKHAEKCVVSNRDEIGCGCDGYHTFTELYEHRLALYLALCRHLTRDCQTPTHNPVWRSKLHHDGTLDKGWFIMGIEKKPGEQISYHLPIRKWDETGFAETLDRAPEWDGHTPDDVIDRLKLF